MHDRYFLRRLPTNPKAEVEKTAIIREKERCDIVCSIVYTAHSLHSSPTAGLQSVAFCGLNEVTEILVVRE